LDDYFSLINASKHKDIHLSAVNQFNPKSTMCFRENNEDGNTQAHKIYQLAVMHNSAWFLMTECRTIHIAQLSLYWNNYTPGGKKKS